MAWSLCLAAVLVVASISQEGGQPKIKLSLEIWEFGALQRGQQVSRVLTITNSGTGILRITQIRSSCATCSVVEGYKESLKSGESTDVKVTFTAGEKKGKVTKTIYIDSNDPDRSRSIFRITGTVRRSEAPEIVIDPNPWYVGSISADSTSEGILLVTNDGLSDLVVKRIESAGCLVRETSLRAIGAGDSGFVHVGFDLTSLVWTGERSIIFHSNDPFQSPLKVKIFAEFADSTDTTSVCVLLFQSEDCPECIELMKEVIVPLQMLYPGFEVRTLSVDNDTVYDMLIRLEHQYNDIGNDIPVLFIDMSVLGGKIEIERDLKERIRGCLQKGGCQYPECKKGETFQRRSVKRTIHIAYFYQPGCKQCDRVSYMLRRMKKRYEKLNITEFNIASIDNKVLNESIGKLLHIPDEDRLITPALVIGDRYLVKEQLTDSRVQSVIEGYRDTGSRCAWEEAKRLEAEARLSIIERFKAFGPMTVVLGGLVDGINPCAFATIIFFLSYLAFMGRKGKDLLYVGMAFTMAVFITYLLIGLGFYHFIQSLKIFAIVSMVIYVITAALSFILGAYSVYDMIKIKRGRVSDISLQLPDFLKKRIHTTIRKRTRMRRFILAAFITGWIVSLLELACTGQVYLPTICFVTGVPELRLHAVFYLILYNLMFILPLCLVFILTYYGTTSDQIAGWMKRHIFLLKAALAVFFLCLGGFLLSVIF